MIYNKKVVAIVPIKEHSERVKGKNFRDFSGKPLFHHILSTLEQTFAIDEVVVDTDSKIVHNDATNLYRKVRTIERPIDLRGDYVSVNKIISYDLTETDGDIYIQTHATNPLLQSETIAKGLKQFVEKDHDCDSIFSVNRYQSRFYLENARAINHDPDELLRTQDLSPVYEENSVLYIFTKSSFEKTKTRIGKNPMMFETPRIDSIDIDDEFTFKLAEMLSLYRDSG